MMPLVEFSSRVMGGDSLVVSFPLCWEVLVGAVLCDFKALDVFLKGACMWTYHCPIAAIEMSEHWTS